MSIYEPQKCEIERRAMRLHQRQRERLMSVWYVSSPLTWYQINEISRESWRALAVDQLWALLRNAIPEPPPTTPEPFAARHRTRTTPGV